MDKAGSLDQDNIRQRPVFSNFSPNLSGLNHRGDVSPVWIFAITIFGIALAEVVAMMVVYFLQDWSYTQRVIIDAFVMTIIIFPMLYVLSFKPLIRQLQYRDQSERILLSRLNLMQYAPGHTLDELFQFALDQVEDLSDSFVSFLYIMEGDEIAPGRQIWSTRTLQSMRHADTLIPYHTSVRQAEVWVQAVRQARPMIYNNYSELSSKARLAQDHIQLSRLLVVPVVRGEEVVALFSVGNKSAPYSESDAERIAAFIDFGWDIIRYKEAVLRLQDSELKFRTLADWTYDWEKWVDPQGKIIYTSPSCETITGYTAQEITTNPEVLIEMIHPEDRDFYVHHYRAIHDEQAAPESLEYRIITRQGSERWIEHLCRPLFSDSGQYLGRRISNRDVTIRKQAEQQILEKSRNELVLSQALSAIRSEIARDLHDTLGQNIGFLRMTLEYLAESEQRDTPDLKGYINNMARAANDSYELIRAMLAVLQLSDASDPLKLFRRYADEVSQRAGFTVQITSTGMPRPISPPQIRQLFYIFREGLSNIEKYAGASHVSAEFIWDEGGFTFQLSDDGAGFDAASLPAPGHYGLTFMRQRAEILKAEFSIESLPGHGSSIRVTTPYEAAPLSQEDLNQ
jgi:PAS domain S-box-containing protein